MPDSKRRANDLLSLKREEDSDLIGDGMQEMIKAIYEDVQVLKHKISRMEEMFTVWKNAKGFITTVRWLGKAFYWVGLVGGMIVASWYAFKKIVTGL